MRETDKGLHQAKVYFDQARAVSGNGCEKVIEQVIYHQPVQVNLLAIFIDFCRRLLGYAPTGQASDPAPNDVDRRSRVVNCWR
ncbi:hypothetical protein D3C85_1677200 [compost metagenome]